MSTWVSPITWANAAVTASQMNVGIRDKMNYLKAALDNLGVVSDVGKQKITPALCGSKVHKASNTLIANATTTALTFDTEDFDSDAFHHASVNTERFTIPAGMGGYYYVGTNISWATNATGYRFAGLRVNGTDIIALSRLVSTTAGNTYEQNISTLAVLAATDFIEVIVAQASGGNLNVEYTDSYSPEFWIHRLSSS